MQNPPLLPPRHPPNWWERNWKWFVALLCAALGASILGFITLVLGFMRSSDAYQGALLRVKQAPAAIEALGSPIKEGFFFTGNIKVSGPSGRAELAIPVTGPKGRATIFVVATKSLGAWHFDQLILQTDQPEQRIDISENKPGPN